MTNQLPVPRVSLLLYHLETGGAESVMVQLCNGFAAHRLQVDLVVLRKEGALLARLSPQVRIVELGGRDIYRAFPALLKYLKRERPDVLLSTFELTSLLALIARLVTRVQTRIIVRIATTLGTFWRPPLKKKLERFLVSRAYPFADAIVAVSQGVADDFARYTGIHRDRVSVIYSPILTDSFSAEAAKPVGHRFFVPNGPAVVLSVGRLTKAKSYETLIRAFALLREQIPAKLLILGEGEERPTLEALTKSLHLTSEVDMPGSVENPIAYMSKAALFVLSSSVEGLPGVLIQALACGAQIVATDCMSGPREILDGGKYGQLVPVGDVNALAAAMQSLLNKDRYPKAPAEWLKQFEVDAVAQQYLGILGLSVCE